MGSQSLARASSPPLLLPALLLALALPAAADEPAPAAAGPLRSVEVGWDGTVAASSPSPVTVVLEHPGPGELVAELVVRSGSETVVEPLSLPAGSRRRVSLALRLEDSQVLVQLRPGEGQPAIASRTIESTRSLPESPMHLLALDGRPPGRRGGGDQRWGDRLLPLLSVGAETAPAEASCYLPFSGVYLRGLDPDLLPDDARAGLLEHVAEGGTVLVAPADGVQTGPALGLFPGNLPARQVSLAGRTVRELRLGLGRILVLPEDLLAVAAGSTADGMAVARELGERLGATTLRRAPWIHDELDALLLGGPGMTTFLLLIGFVLVYLLVVGPGLMLFGRRANRRRLFRWVVGLVAAFTLVAPLVAGLVRAAPGTAYQHVALWVPPEGGPAVELGDITVVSGGSARATLELGGGPLAATLHAPDPRREMHWDGRVYGRAAVAYSVPRTRRGEEVVLDLAMSPWGRQSVSTLALVPRPSPVRVTLGSDLRVARIENLGDQPLRGALLLAAEVPDGPEAGYVHLGDVAPGQAREVDVPPDWVRQIDLRHTPGWADRLGVVPSFRCWGRLVAPLLQGEAAPRMLLLSRVEPRVQVRGRRLSTSVSAVRIDPVAPPASAARGYCGFRLADQGGMVYVEEVAAGGPAAAAGLAPGDYVTGIDGQSVGNTARLRARLARALAGERVRLEVYASRRNGERTVELVLEGRSRLAGGD